MYMYYALDNFRQKNIYVTVVFTVLETGIDFCNDDIMD